MSEERKCAYKFQHPSRPRDRCGLEADRACHCAAQDPDWPGPHCFWHCPEINKSPEDEAERRRIRERLERAVRSGQYLEGGCLNDAHLEGAALVGAHLEGASLDGAHLEGAAPVGAHLEEARLERAQLQGAILEIAHLEGADLEGAQLEGAALSGAHLEGAELWGAHLEGAVLWRARLDGASLARLVLSPASICDETEWGICGGEREGYWDVAADAYRRIGLHYRDVGDYQRCDEFYFREMRMYHRSLVDDGKPAVAADWSKGTWPALAQTWRGWREYLAAEYRRHHAGAMTRVLHRAARRLCDALRNPAVRRGFAWVLLIARAARRSFGLLIVAACLAVSAIWARAVRPTPPGGWLTRFIWAGHRLLWGYGIRPARTVGWMGFVVAVFTLGFRFLWPIVGPDGRAACSARLAFAVALDAFTSVGYAGYRPETDGGQLAAGVAGLCGMILAAAFVVALGTKYVRRAS